MAATAPVTRTLRFDVFELNARAGELRKRGVKLEELWRAAPPVNWRARPQRYMTREQKTWVGD